jgi:hypothetical protein
MHGAEKSCFPGLTPFSRQFRDKQQSHWFWSVFSNVTNLTDCEYIMKYEDINQIVRLQFEQKFWPRESHPWQGVM